jgi:hypothetical protein
MECSIATPRGGRGSSKRVEPDGAADLGRRRYGGYRHQLTYEDAGPASLAPKAMHGTHNTQANLVPPGGYPKGTSQGRPYLDPVSGWQGGVKQK